MFESREAQIHREQERALIQMGEVCDHGRGLGHSSFDAPYCYQCELDDYYSDVDDYAEAIDSDDIPEVAKKYLTKNQSPMADDVPF